jgi:hypothetical protein
MIMPQKHSTCVALLAMAALCLPATAHAQTTTLVDVCGWAFDRVLVPATYRDVLLCDDSWKMCAFVDAQCCVPGVCQLLPHCVITETAINVAAHYEDKWVFKCERISAEDAWQRWLRHQIPSVDSLALPYLLEVAKRDVDWMRLAAKPLPTHVVKQVNGMLKPFMRAGTSKVTPNEITNVKIISETNANAGLYLPDGAEGVTLYDVVVLRSDHYKDLMNATNSFSAADIRAGTVSEKYVDSLMTIIHEMVHVRQYAELGFHSFVTNYLLEAAVKGYGSNSFEKEAWRFEALVDGDIPGTQVAEYEQMKATARALGVGAAAVVQSPERWRGVTADFSTCLATGKAPNAIPPEKCKQAMEERFALHEDRAVFPRETARLPGPPAMTPRVIPSPEPQPSSRP